MDVAEWLRALILANTRRHSVKDLGVTPGGHRRRLLDAITALRGDTDVARNTRSASNYPQQSQQPTAERRHISAMFCDVAGFTTLSSRLDPEDLSAVIRGYQACVTKTNARFGRFGDSQ